MSKFTLTKEEKQVFSGILKRFLEAFPADDIENSPGDSKSFTMQVLEAARETTDPDIRRKPVLVSAAIVKLSSRGEFIDRVTVADEMMKNGTLESAGGLQFLVSIGEAE